MIRTILLLAVLLSASVAASEDAPMMWMAQDENTINLMVNTSANSGSAGALVTFDPAVINITDVDVSMSPWTVLDGGTGWSHQGDYVKIALVNMEGVDIGEYQIASMSVDCVGYGDTVVSLSQADPPGILTQELTYSCGDAPIDEGAAIAIGSTVGAATLPITISGAENVGACDVTLTYDPTVVRVASVTAGGMDCTYTNTENDGTVRLGAVQGDSPGLGGNFTLLDVELEPVTLGMSCALTLSVTTFKDATPNCTAMTYTVSSGTFSTPVPTPNGDANDDGQADVADAAYIAKYVIGITGYETINLEAADVTGDGIVDMSDSMYLSKHLLGEVGFETLR
ncbi:MAG: dockerin type I domain-containing protein [Euryarchaeota archaeon]|nr:dockerin type I domain-containing protein [Euryarchaeota archaeon]